MNNINIDIIERLKELHFEVIRERPFAHNHIHTFLHDSEGRMLKMFIGEPIEVIENYLNGFIDAISWSMGE